MAGHWSAGTHAEELDFCFDGLFDGRGAAGRVPHPADLEEDGQVASEYDQGGHEDAEDANHYQIIAATLIQGEAKHA